MAGMGAVWNQHRSLRYLQEGGAINVRRTARNVWSSLRAFRRQLLLGTLLMILGIGLGLIPPLLIRAIIDQAIPQHNLRLALLLGSGLLLVPAGAAVLSLGQNYVAAIVAQGLIADLRSRLYRHTQGMGLDFFTWTRGGEIHTRFLNDLGSLQNVLTQSFLGMAANLLTVIFTLAVMATIDWRLTLTAALALPAFALPVLHFGRRRYDAVTRAQAALGDLSVVLEETLSLSGAMVVKSFGTEEREAKRFDVVNTIVRKAQVQQMLEGQWLAMVVQILAALGPAALYTYGAYLVIHGELQLGTIVAFATYLAQLYSPASSLAGANATLLGGLALFDRVFQLLELPHAVPEPYAPVPLPAQPSGGIAFENVSFGYPGRDRPVEGESESEDERRREVLHGVSFVARPGELTALVGPSGAGKTTILSLAARFYDPTGGVIRLDGVPLPDISRQDLRQHLAVVTQDVFLFHATLRENVCYGAPEASEDEIQAVVDAAQLRDVVARLPDGLDTIIGERGFRLSGGEKQRVAIARALLRQAPYLLLDEATSSLDSQAERAIQAALERLFQGRTVIAIAHRLSTVVRADQILVIERGEIVERGTHAELLAHSGLYQQLYEAQFSPDGADGADGAGQDGEGEAALAAPAVAASAAG
ncbi:MAG TPA: ABC transporter ATP-binding protein [Thermomicrobiaceae bacterium]|nr:ABC transporter ATP-binding protein [Thermomicrobiaceae bacterium]